MTQFISSELTLGASGWARRDLIAAMGALVAAGTTGCCTKPPPNPIVGTVGTGIDVHCHIFNARDIPIAGFMTDVVLEGIPPAQLALEPLIILLSMIMDTCAWTAQRELEALTNGDHAEIQSAPTLSSLTLKAKVQAQAAQSIATFQQKAGRYSEFKSQVEKYLSATAPKRVMELKAMGDDASLLRTLAARAGAPVKKNGRLFSLQEVDPNVAAQGIASIQDEVYGVFLLATLVTERRIDLMRTLAGLPSTAADADSIAMYNPAMVDYSYWLGESVSPLTEQIAVMTAIAAYKELPYAVHPWVSFCPWRQINEPDQFALVQSAVRSGGFMGVKLYPVMGFRPIGNDGASDAAQYPPKLRDIPDWGRQLDTALGKLYDWCVDEKVPILAHCSLSQFPSEAAGMRGAPVEWEKVLMQPKWNDLRLNLGHLGGFWGLAKSPNDGWTKKVIELLATYPNVYADVADDSDIVDRTPTDAQNDKAELDALKILLDQSHGPYAPRSKIMYGTDWVMLSRAMGVDAYLADMRSKFASALDLSVDAFLGRTAARFTGLDQPNNGKHGTTKRLEDFYMAHGKSKEFLKRWQEAG